jgi:transcriptional regulator with XRE-family HTH domain
VLSGKMAEPSGLMKRLQSRNGETIRAKREELGWSQAHLAQLAKTTQQTVDRIERGVTQHSRAFEAVRAALGLAPFVASAEEMDQRLRAAGYRGEETSRLLAVSRRPAEPDLTLLPVYQVMIREEHVLSTEPVDYIERPAPLARVHGGYAVIIFSDENDPALRPGDIAFVNPHLPPRFRNEVLISNPATFDASNFQLGHDWPPTPIFIGTLVEQDKDRWMLDQWNPERRLDLPKADWPICHVIIGKYSNT